MFGGGREADEIEVEAAEEGAFGGFWGGGKVLAFQFRQDVTVDGVAGPGLVFDCRVLRFGGGLAEPGPVGVGGVCVDGELGDFGFDFGDGFGGELGAEGHLRGLFAGHVGDDQVPGGAVFAAFLEGFDGVKTEAALSLGTRVAGAAVLGEQGEQFAIGGGEEAGAQDEAETHGGIVSNFDRL